jgi:hypothetical protein
MFCLLGLVLVSVTAAHHIADFSDFDHQISLTDGYDLFWSLSDDLTSITLGFNVTCNGNYFAFGIGEYTTGSMPGSDILVVTVDSQTYDVTIQDYFADAFDAPDLDACQSWNLEAAEVMFDPQNASEIMNLQVIVSRNTSIQNDNQDRPFETDVGKPTQVIWAIGSTPELSYHGDDRDHQAVYFGGEEDISTDAFLHIDFTLQNVTLPQNEVTVYMSQSFQAPSFSSQQYLVGFEIIIGDSLKSAEVHHAILLACEKGNSSWVQSIASAPTEVVVTECSHQIYTWVPGADVWFLPDDAHYKIGKSGYQFFAIELHYNNPSLAIGEVDNQSGVRLFYQMNPRKYEAAVLQIGDPYLSYPNVLLPGQSSIHLEFDCPTQCTAALPQQINIFAGLLHSHMLGKSLWSSIWRKETPQQGENLIRGEYYSFHNQHHSLLNETLHPGDRLSAHCVYDTSAKTANTSIGLGTMDEMCIIFLYYYPKVDFTYCGFFYDSDYSPNNLTMCPDTSSFKDIRNPSVSDDPSGVQRVFGNPKTETCHAVTSTLCGVPQLHSKLLDSNYAVVKTLFALLVIGGFLGGVVLWRKKRKQVAVFFDE